MIYSLDGYEMEDSASNEDNVMDEDEMMDVKDLSEQDKEVLSSLSEGRTTIWF